MPEKNRELCGKIYEKIDNFVKIDALPMASIRDFAKVLVSMAGNQFVNNIGGNRNGMLIEKEPDIIVNSEDTNLSELDFSMNTKLLYVRGVLIPIDAYKTTLLIDVETTHGQKNIIQHDELSKIFCNNNNRYAITNSVEAYGRRGESLYYTPSLREANGFLDDMEKYFIIDKNVIDTNSSAKMARHLVSKFEQHELLNFPALNPNAECYIKAGKNGLGVKGQIILRTWNNGIAGSLGGKFVPISADISDIERIMNSPATQENLTFAMVRDLIKTTSVKDTSSSGLELPANNSTQAPINEKYTAPQTPPKTETNFFTFSLNKMFALAAYSSSSSLSSHPMSSLPSKPSSSLWSYSKIGKNLNPPSTTLIPSKPLNYQLSTMNLGAGHK